MITKSKNEIFKPKALAAKAIAVQSSTHVISTESNKANSAVTSAQPKKASFAPKLDYTTTKPPSYRAVA